MFLPRQSPPSRDRAININEFTNLCKNLFRNEHGKPHQVSIYTLEGIYEVNREEIFVVVLISGGDYCQSPPTPLLTLNIDFP